MENHKFDELEKSLRKELERTGSVIRKGKFTTYRSIVYEGILGDMGTEYWTEDN